MFYTDAYFLEKGVIDLSITCFKRVLGAPNGKSNITRKLFKS